MQKQKADLDIESGKFERIYLLYGDESYLLKAYKDKLKNAIIPEQESLNLAYFDNVQDNIDKIRDFADTMPFFGDRRLIIIDKASAFKKDSGLADYVPDIPETSTIIIVDDEVDKRSRLYKAIQKNGAVMELKKLSYDDLKVFIVSRLKRAGKGITEKDCEYFIDCVGDDLYTIVNEADKCIACAGDGNAVDRKIINEICSMQIENKIFDMVDAILKRNRNLVFNIYGDLKALRENSFAIMAVIRRNYNQMLQVRELSDRGCSVQEIAQRSKTADWLVKKQLQKVKGYGAERLKSAIEVIVNTEYDIKTGNLAEETGIEIMLAKLLEL